MSDALYCGDVVATCRLHDGNSLVYPATGPALELPAEGARLLEMIGRFDTLANHAAEVCRRLGLGGAHAGELEQLLGQLAGEDVLVRGDEWLRAAVAAAATAAGPAAAVAIEAVIVVAGDRPERTERCARAFAGAGRELVIADDASEGRSAAIAEGLRARYIGIEERRAFAAALAADTDAPPELVALGMTARNAALLHTAGAGVVVVSDAVAELVGSGDGRAGTAFTSRVCERGAVADGTSGIEVFEGLLGLPAAVVASARGPVDLTGLSAAAARRLRAGGGRVTVVDAAGAARLTVTDAGGAVAGACYAIDNRDGFVPEAPAGDGDGNGNGRVCARMAQLRGDFVAALPWRPAALPAQGAGLLERTLDHVPASARGLADVGRWLAGLAALPAEELLAFVAPLAAQRRSAWIACAADPESAREAARRHVFAADDVAAAAAAYRAYGALLQVWPELVAAAG